MDLEVYVSLIERIGLPAIIIGCARSGMCGISQIKLVLREKRCGRKIPKTMNV